jgi:hypothetical protein
VDRARIRTVLDDPIVSQDSEEREFVDQIREHGWFDTHVLGEGEYPGFSYSTGFWLTSGMPEVLIVGLKRKIAHDILWDLFRDFKGDASFPIGVPSEGIFGNARGCFLPVGKAHYPEHLGWSRWFYGGDDFPCLQLVWPDPKGRFPWQPGFDGSFRLDQPDLTEHGWVAGLAH